MRLSEITGPIFEVSNTSHPDPERWRPILDAIEQRARALGVDMQLYPMSTNNPREIMKGDAGWALAWIKRENAPKGSGRKAMEMLNAEADKHGQKVSLQADDVDGLQPYYEALGYAVKKRNKDGVLMVRKPVSATKKVVSTTGIAATPESIAVGQTVALNDTYFKVYRERSTAAARKMRGTVKAITYYGPQMVDADGPVEGGSAFAVVAWDNPAVDVRARPNSVTLNIV